MLAAILSFFGFLSNFGRVLTIVSVVGAGAVGAFAMHKWDKAAELRTQVKALQYKLETERMQRENEQKAREADAIQADADKEDMMRLEGIINGLKFESPNKQCFTAAESERLLKLWQ